MTYVGEINVTDERTLRTIVDQLPSLTEGERWLLSRILQSSPSQLAKGTAAVSVRFTPPVAMSLATAPSNLGDFQRLKRPPYSLTAREIDVLGCILKGLTNKQVAKNLGVSPRTVEVHRSRIMGKLEAKTPAQLVMIVRDLFAR